MKVHGGGNKIIFVFVLTEGQEFSGIQKWILFTPEFSYAWKWGGHKNYSQ